MSLHYPTQFGVPVNPNELNLPPTTLDIENRWNRNNHHGSYFQRYYITSLGGNALLQTFRNLEFNQFIIPVDTHNFIHSTYEPPILPTPHEAMDRVAEAYETGERLKFGSANNPRYEDITNAIYLEALEAYREAA